MEKIKRWPSDEVGERPGTSGSFPFVPIFPAPFTSRRPDSPPLGLRGCVQPGACVHDLFNPFYLNFQVFNVCCISTEDILLVSKSFGVWKF